MSASPPLAGKVAFVTGGAGHVGECISRQLAASGATVLINCFHSYDRAKALAAELTASGARAEVIRGSVAKPDHVERMFAEVDDRYGTLDILVNNAAAGTFIGIGDLTEEQLDRAFRISVKGALWCSRTARPLLARSGRGTIVNVSSVGSDYAPANYVCLGICKAALESLTRYLAAEFADDGIRVNTASAGLIDNPVGRSFPGFETLHANTVKATPLGRLGRSEELSNLVAYLAGPGAEWITGQKIVADGGMSLLHQALSPDPSPNSEDGDLTADPIVVVGMGLAVPGASDPEEFWKLLMDGGDLFSPPSGDRWTLDEFHDSNPAAPDKTYQRRAGFITGFTPHRDLAAELEGPSRDREFTVVWLRHSVHQALEGVGRGPSDRFFVSVGYTPDGSQHLQEALVRGEIADLAASHGMRPDDPDLTRLLDTSLPKGRAAVPPHEIGAAAVAGLVPPGTRVSMIDSACSSSLYSIDLGVRAIVAGDADVAVCGGTFALAPTGAVLFSKLYGLSQRGEVRALDKDADGVVFSDGAGVVVLKRLSKARADGDRVHGVVAGCGLSADGKGKAIYAPASAGQETSIARAFARSGLSARDVDWVIAHATGTPTGDEAEVRCLRSAYAGDHPVRVTSNKSLIGHTGWSAGVISVIHALLAMRHGFIPPQHHFSETPPYLDLESTNLEIPTEPVPWPRRNDRTRTAGVSGFGFGGTNAHLLIQEFHPERPGQFGYGRPSRERLALVGWSAHLPGCDDQSAVERSVAARSEPPASFGDTYPTPPLKRLRMPPVTVKATDRTQLMIVECMQRLDPRVRAQCEDNRDTTGVVVGHHGPTRNAVLYALRAYRDGLSVAADGAAAPESVLTVLKGLAVRAESRIGAPTEASFPGAMPNVVPARLCNYFDLRGLNVSVDAGATSLSAAFDLAGRYLLFGDLDIALVAAVNGNSLPSWRSMADGGDLAEGAYLFAVARRSHAVAHGLPVLAEFDVPNGGRMSTEDSP